METQLINRGFQFEKGRRFTQIGAIAFGDRPAKGSILFGGGFGFAILVLQYGFA